MNTKRLIIKGEGGFDAELTAGTKPLYVDITRAEANFYVLTPNSQRRFSNYEKAKQFAEFIGPSATIAVEI